jgi:hypothetical protein
MNFTKLLGTTLLLITAQASIVNAQITGGLKIGKEFYLLAPYNPLVINAGVEFPLDSYSGIRANFEFNLKNEYEENFLAYSNYFNVLPYTITVNSKTKTPYLAVNADYKFYATGSYIRGGLYLFAGAGVGFGTKSKKYDYGIHSPNDYSVDDEWYYESYPDWSVFMLYKIQPGAGFEFGLGKTKIYIEGEGAFIQPAFTDIVGHPFMLTTTLSIGVRFDNFSDE